MRGNTRLERRLQKRKRVASDVTAYLRVGAARRRGVLRDLSATGAFVTAPTTGCHRGRLVELTLAYLAGPVVRMRCLNGVVAHVDTDGAGLTFISRHASRYLRRLQAGRFTRC